MHARSLRAALYASLLTASCALKLSAVDAGVASVAKLRPSDNKDAFFTAAPRFYGVFDGVSQCPESRIYAQTLAKETSAALKRSGDAGGSWSDQAQAALLQAAQAADRYSGSSTAIMMRLDLDQPQPQVCTFALGDSSALVLKYQPDGSYAVGDTSGVMYHDNGAPYPQHAQSALGSLGSQPGVRAAIHRSRGAHRLLRAALRPPAQGRPPPPGEESACRACRACRVVDAEEGRRRRSGAQGRSGACPRSL